MKFHQVVWDFSLEHGYDLTCWGFIERVTLDWEVDDLPLLAKALKYYGELTVIKAVLIQVKFGN